ncbi:MAG TPA: alpha-hydroxy-acid oxidizing protein, partial [Candidatus Limnocylindrales bacterium]|nr:alpha-hydroxy-acid oxidizing protein [Candidatus Limnocylindrales bacterium]
MKLEELITLGDFEVAAPQHMSPMAHAYVSGGAADELTLRANEEDWKRLRLKPRVLVDVSELDLRTEILGQKFELPILLAPAAFHRLCCP